MDLLARLELAHHEDRAANGRWVVLALDPDDGEVINATGPYSSEEEAFLAGSDADRAFEAVFGESLRRVVVPLFAPG